MAELPTVENIYFDVGRGITYKIMAFRKLNRDEMLAGVRIFMQQKKRKAVLRPGSVIRIISLLR